MSGKSYLMSGLIDLGFVDKDHFRRWMDESILNIQRVVAFPETLFMLGSSCNPYKRGLLIDFCWIYTETIIMEILFDSGENSFVDWSYVKFLKPLPKTPSGHCFQCGFLCP